MGAPCARPLAPLALAALVAATSAAAAAAEPLCASPAGAFVMLAADADSYSSVPGAAPAGGGEAPSWRTVQAAEAPAEGSPKNSFADRWLQALPDAGAHFPPRPHAAPHEPLAHAADLTGVAPYVAARLRVGAGRGGTHTAFIRWTAGDAQGGGDSMYVAMFDAATGEVVPGPDTLRPKVEGIAAHPGRWAGCCYDTTTHACPCFAAQPAEDECRYFQPAADASAFGATCLVGRGVLETVRSPEWYEFAGQLQGDSQDFDSEPWDATCGAAADDTYDQGLDFAQWALEGGKEYELRLYAREDGTALDAVYVAGPQAPPPDPDVRFRQGESTLCAPEPPSSSSTPPPGSAGWSWGSIFLATVAVLVVVAGLAYAAVAVRRAGGPAAAWSEARARLGLGGRTLDFYHQGLDDADII